MVLVLSSFLALVSAFKLVVLVVVGQYSLTHRQMLRWFVLLEVEY